MEVVRGAEHRFVGADGLGRLALITPALFSRPSAHPAGEKRETFRGNLS